MNEFLNYKKAIDVSKPFWDISDEAGLTNVTSKNHLNGLLSTEGGHTYANMSSYSYLGLDSDDRIVQGAIDAMLTTKSLNSSSARIRIHYDILKQAEDRLSETFQEHAITVSSCSAAASAVLPLLSSGVLTKNKPPTMIFDKQAHLCMNVIKPLCADETTVLTCPHNDINYIESYCKKNSNVAVVVDSVYSTGGLAPIRELFELQNKYGIFLLFDDAHSTSVYGSNGRGHVLDYVDQLNERTIIISSLNKGFGASGGMILLGDSKWREPISRFGGPFSWSQRINTAGLGAIIASCDIHSSGEIEQLQNRLMKNIEIFDSLVKTNETGDGLPIRLIPVKNEDATVNIAKNLFQEGFYTSPLFFPVVSRSKSGLRVMIRSDMSQEQILSFSEIFHSLDI